MDVDTAVTQLRQAVVERFDEIYLAHSEHLRATGSPLIDIPDAGRLASYRSMLLPVLAGVSEKASTGTAAGQSVGSAQIHPVHAVESIAAYGHLVAERIVTSAAELGTPIEAVVQVVGDLYRGLMRRIVLSTAPWASMVLEQVHTGHLEERRRIARTLHDEVAHALAIADQQLELRHLAEARGNLESAARHDSVLATVLREVGEVVRSLSDDLGRRHTATGLARAVAGYVDLIDDERVTLSVDDTESANALPEWLAEEFFLALREAIRNAVAHSGATRIEVDLQARGRGVVARVRDDGTGFDPGQRDDQSHGHGLVSMRERLRNLLGDARIESSPEVGTTVTLTVQVAR